MNKIVFLFPGQGSQYVGMGKSWYNKYSIAKKTFNEAGDVLNFDLKNICFKRPFTELSSGRNLQPAILTVSVAIYRSIKSEIDFMPDCLAGYSFGELAALVCAGAVSFDDALKICQFKWNIVKDTLNQSSAMTAVFEVEQYTIKKICRDCSTKNSIAVIAMINSPKQIVISGNQDAVIRVEQKLKTFGASFERLKINAPYHSPLLAKAAKRIRRRLGDFKFKAPAIPVWSSFSEKFYENTNEIKDALSLNLVIRINWPNQINKLENLGADQAFEVGPKSILTGLMPHITKRIKATAIQKPEDLTLLEEKLFLDKKNKKDFIIKCLKIAVCTKNNNLNQEQFRKDAVVPYNKIKNMMLEIEKKDMEPNLNQIESAFKMLLSVFRAKKTDLSYQKEILKELFISHQNFFKLSRLKKINDRYL